MPLSIEKNGLIFTKISFTNLSGSAIFKTHVHVPINKFVPIFIVSIKDNQNFFEWGVVEKKDRKYFAFFINASLMKKIPEDNVYSIGAFDELIETFWEEKQIPKDNHLTIIIGLNMNKIYTNFEFFWWFTDDWKIEIGGSLNTQASFTFGIKCKSGEDLKMGGFLIYEGDNEFLIALGFSDQTNVFSKLSLQVGWYPLVFNPTRWEFRSNIWKIKAWILDKDIMLNLNFFLSKEKTFFSTEIGMRIYKSLFLVAGFEHNLNKYGLSLGFRWQF